MDADFERRAQQRKLRMVGGTARSFAELDAAGAEHWTNASFEDRLRATYEAVLESWMIQGKDGPPPRFDGSTWGVLEFAEELAPNEFLFFGVPPNRVDLLTSSPPKKPRDASGTCGTCYY